MEKFEYYNPVRVIFGEGKIGQAGICVEAYGKKVMLVTYANPYFFKGVIDKLHKDFEQHNIACTDFAEVSANPLLSQARAGIEICRREKIEAVVALGGGSVMDCAKIIAAGVYYKYDVKKMIMLSHSEIDSIPPEFSLPTVMIPTIPATGSEMNPTAVITDDVSGKKSYVWTPCLYPRAAIMDPELTLSLPPYQTACGAFDIAAHVIEAYLNGNTGYDLTLQDKMQEGVIKAVFETLEKVWKNPNDIQARGILMWAASIALNGWLTSGTFGFTPMHQMGHVLSARYNATHGATLACMMPAWMRYFSKRGDNARYKQFAKRIFGCGIEEAADKFEEKMRLYGIQTRITQFGAKPEDIESLADTVVSVSFSADGTMNGNPRTDRADILGIYRLSL